MKINELVQAIVQTVQIENKRLSAREDVPTANQNRIIATMIATRLGMVEMDVVTDKGIVLRQYYEANIAPLVVEIVSAVNEKHLIDHKTAIELTFHIWHHRCLIAQGKVFAKPMLQYMASSPALNDINRQDVESYLKTL